MLDINFISEHLDLVKKNLKNRADAFKGLDDLLALNKKRKECIAAVELKKQTQNQASKEIAQTKDKKEASTKIAAMKTLSAEVKELSTKRSEIEEKLKSQLLLLPNILDESVPVGKSEKENKEVRKWGKVPSFSFKAKDHLTLGETLGIIDTKRAAKIAGARFALFLNQGALLSRALSQFMLDCNTKESGYQEIVTPFIVNESAMTGTGQLPKFKQDLFQLAGTSYYLIPTAEVPLTNIYRDEILSADQLPVKMTALTPCFRSEAGSYGKDVKGLIRQHQFDKVEIVQVVKPDQSEQVLEQLTNDAEKILQKLELPYRVMTLCSADTGFSAKKTYDLEVWLPSQDRYREISSCSNFGDFQARRMNMRYRPDSKAKPQFPHTLNGSALAVGRTLIAILENFQNEDGSIRIPKNLQPYMGVDKIG